MLKRDTPGFTNLDLNQLIRDVDHIIHGDAVAHKVTVELDLWPGVLLVKRPRKLNGSPQPMWFRLF